MIRVDQRDVALPDSLLLDAGNAARLLGVSKSSFLRMDAKGVLGPRSLRLGAGEHHRRLWRRSDIVAWVEEGACCPRAEWLQREKGAAG